MEFVIFNTITRKKEIFVPIIPGKVGIYSCGPTVYSEQHMGNMRAVFVVDLLKNALRFVGGYETLHVMNVTDVGHLTGDNDGDADHGEDRMEKGARKEGITAWDVAEKYLAVYMQDLATLRIDSFTVMPKATAHIDEQIAMIQELESKGYTYVIEGDGVYMDTSKIENYDVLVGKKHMEGIEQWARVDDAGKKNPTDFALWKFNVTGKKRDMEWESPWWIGFPGWHIECSAMSMKYLGNHIDIHTGWVEHIPVHHTNEIAQSECSHWHHPWVNYRMHYQHLMMNGKKLAKSDGNVAFVREIRERGFSGEDLRLFFMQAHYRSFQDFTWEWLEAARTTRHNIIKKIAGAVGDRIVTLYGLQMEDMNDIVYTQLIEPLIDDLDTPQLLARVQKMLGVANDDIIKALLLLDHEVLKLGLYEWVVKLIDDEAMTVNVPADIRSLADERWAAKAEKNRLRADQLREELAHKGWVMKDGQDGYTLAVSA